VAVSWAWPFLGYNVLQIVVSTNSAPGGLFQPAYVASVVAADGLLDVAVLKLDFAIDAAGALTPLTPGSLNLPAVPLATAEAAPGAAVVLATYAEAADIPGGVGTYTEFAGTVTAYATDDVHIPGVNAWLNTDIAAPIALPGGPIVDTNGSLVAFADWLAQSPPEHIWGPSAPLIAPVIAAAKSGTAYTSPHIVAGSGLELMPFTGWTAADPGCPPGTPVNSYPTGSTRIASTFSYSGWTDGEDHMVFWWDPVQQQILLTKLGQWAFGAAGTCYTNSINAGGSPLPDGTYAINIFGGGDLHFVSGAKVVVGQPGAGAVSVTGRVLDADTGKPINFVLVDILKPGVDPQAWASGGSQADVASSGLTDETGTYTTKPPIAPGSYPFVVIAFDAHRSIFGTLTVPADGKLPDITLVPTT
jgi:hypothetical protein